MPISVLTVRVVDNELRVAKNDYDRLPPDAIRGLESIASADGRKLTVVEELYPFDTPLANVFMRQGSFETIRGSMIEPSKTYLPDDLHAALQAAMFGDGGLRHKIEKPKPPNHVEKFIKKFRSLADGEKEERKRQREKSRQADKGKGGRFTVTFGRRHGPTGR